MRWKQYAQLSPAKPWSVNREQTRMASPDEPPRPWDQPSRRARSPTQCTTPGPTRPVAGRRGPPDAEQRSWHPAAEIITVSANTPPVTRTPLYRQVNGYGQAPAWGADLGCIRPPRQACTSIVFVQLSERVRPRLGARSGTQSSVPTCSLPRCDATGPGGVAAQSTRPGPLGHSRLSSRRARWSAAASRGISERSRSTGVRAPRG
jgi:hypothetical protein